LACTFTSPCLGYEPKAKVAIVKLIMLIITMVELIMAKPTMAQLLMVKLIMLN
jgi:hypothetical protein